MLECIKMIKSQVQVGMYGPMDVYMKEHFQKMLSNLFILFIYRHGKGKLIYTDGRQIKGVWEEGALLEAVEENKK